MIAIKSRAIFNRCDLSNANFSSASLENSKFKRRSKMHVYRVENTEGKGPYVGNTDFIYSLLEKVYGNARAHNDKNHPIPLDDGISRAEYLMEQKACCGFLTKKQLKDWFSIELRRELSGHGFDVSVYEVEPGYVYTGNTQVLFFKENSKRLNRIRTYLI